MGISHKIIEFRKTQLFQTVSPYFLLGLAKEAEWVDLPKNQTIFHEGDLPTGLYIVVAGKVKIHRKNKVLGIITDHGYFGELALIDNKARTASATTTTDVSMLYIDKYLFDNAINNFPEVMLEIAKSIIRYMK